MKTTMRLKTKTFFAFLSAVGMLFAMTAAPASAYADLTGPPPPPPPTKS